MTRTKYLAIAFALSNVLMASCVADSEPTDPTSESLGVSTDALSGLVTASWGGVGNGTPFFTNGSRIVLPLGVGNGWMCWLSAVHGTMGATGHVGVVHIDSFGDPPDGVAPNEWALIVEPAAGLAASAGTVCAPVTDRGTFDVGSAPSTVLTSGTGDDWCGLQEMFSFSGATPHVPWTQTTDVLTVSDNGTNPGLIANGPTWTLSGSINGSGQANCAQANVSGGWAYTIIAPSSGTAGFNLLQNNGTSLPSGTACFLTSVQGAFVNSNFSDGVGLSLSGSMWSLSATNGKHASVLCIL